MAAIPSRTEAVRWQVVERIVDSWVNANPQVRRLMPGYSLSHDLEKHRPKGATDAEFHRAWLEIMIMFGRKSSFYDTRNVGPFSHSTGGGERIIRKGDTMS